MKRTVLLLALFVMLAFTAGNAGAALRIEGDCGGDIFRGDDISIDFEDGTIILECRDNDDMVEISEDYKLFINGDRIKLNEGQQELVEKYYDSFDEIIDLAKEISIEGARIGAKGAELGLKAVSSVFKLIEEDYDTDDLEREMERQAERIEAQAEKLEEKGEKLEDIADRFERTHRKMRNDIDELGELGWF